VVDHSKQPFKIVVSLPIFVDLVKEITGDQAQVTALIPPGADPQTYVPSPDMAKAVSDANMIFYNGLDLEPPTERFIQQHLTRPAFVVDFARNVPSPSTQQPLDKPIYAKQVGDDPHLFLDPGLISVYPETVADSMVIKDGQNQAYYNARFQQYLTKLNALNAEVLQKMGNIPAQNRGLLVTYHNSLIWFAKRYGLGVAGTIADSGQAGLAQIVATNHAPAVFTETAYDTSGLTQIANAAGIKVCNLDTDAVADANMTYIKMMENDADAIASCLS
jgi:ABC-type Zn uptake system ZnuABC Zn-binding protein ZnuA